MDMDDLRNREYNGWENRWTWLVHLHLSNEQALFLEIAQLVASEPDDVLAGLLVEAWVRSAITSWMTRSRPSCASSAPSCASRRSCSRISSGSPATPLSPR